MKIPNSLFAIALLPALVGCTTATKPIALVPVGPAPTVVMECQEEGFLQVYSAREQREPVNLNGLIYVEGNKLDEDMMYELAHTGYTIYSQDGQLVKHVRNARGINDGIPTRVTLPVGSYRIEAEARNYGLVMVPVVIEPGQLTAVHLQRNWTPTTRNFQRDDFVWLGDRPVGWKATLTESGFAATVGGSHGPSSSGVEGKSMPAEHR